MPECECLPRCPFFNGQMTITPSMVEIKQRYCLTDNKVCARYMVMKTLGPERVPLKLYPFELNQAIRIIQGEKIPVSVI